MADKDVAFLETGNLTTSKLIKGYWQSEQRVSAWCFFALIILITVLLVGMDVIFNYWNNYFYNALQAYDKHSVIRLLVMFVVIAFISIILQVYRYYVAQIFGLRWRNWLTDQFIVRWLQKRGYYYLETFDKSTDNPDQRLQEDILSLVTTSLELTIGLVAAITTVPAFIYILWTLSGTLTIPLGPLGTFQLQGYLVWVSLIYSIGGTLLAFKIGRPLVPLNFEQQRREANFRYAAIDLRTHSEDVALYRGEAHQKVTINNLFLYALENYYNLVKAQKRLVWFTGSYAQLSVMLPLLVAMPNYFNKVFLLGGLIQTLRAFSSVQDSMSYLISSFTTIAQWRAISLRLTTFVNHLYESETRADKADHLSFVNTDSKQIKVSDLTIRTPREQELLQDVNCDFEHGKDYVIKGRSGLGKSTFIRTLANIWPFAQGQIEMANDSKKMFLPQKPYMPIGTLEEAILFPDKPKPELRGDVERTLIDVNLEHLIPRLNDTAMWSEQLSPGELQRIAFARVLLSKPDWVFLDESTSMLDLKNETRLYKLIHEKLPNCSIISVGHRPSLDEFHDTVIDMEKFAPSEDSGI